MVAYYIHDHGCGVSRIGRSGAPAAAGQPACAQWPDLGRTLRLSCHGGSRYDAPGGDEASGDPGGGKPGGERKAWPGEAALHQSRADPCDRRTLDQEVPAAPADGAVSPEKVPGARSKMILLHVLRNAADSRPREVT